MRLNWNPTRVAFIDFETQSNTELTTVHKYATADDTRMLTCVVKDSDGVIHRIGPYLDAKGYELLARIGATHTLVAHNAPFDAAIWEHTCKLPEAEWFDTLPCARAAGLPGKLDDLGMRLTGEGKDKNGKRLIDMLCILRNNKIPAIGPAHGLLMEYNVRDVELLEQIFEQVKPYTEPDVMTVDRIINDRGVPIDRKYLMDLLELYETNSTKLRKEFEDATGGVNPGSAKQVKDWIRNSGFKVPQLADKEGNKKDSIGKFAMKDFLARPEDYYLGDDAEANDAIAAMAEAMELRKEVVRVGQGKAEAALRCIELDDRVREQFVYWGAHTGRWSGRDLQLHNMPKQEIDVRNLGTSYEDIRAAALEATQRLGYRVLNADVLGGMLRAMVRADNMLVADYGAVEARGIAWVAGCQKMLTLYSDPQKSVYLDMGKALFGRAISKTEDKQEYTMAKTLVLGCGYGMSGAKFEYTCKSRGISTAVFEKAGMRAADAVKVYRETYPEIPAIWKAYGSALLDVVRIPGTVREVGKVTLYMEKGNLICVLPSGRKLVYRDAQIAWAIPAWQKLYNMPETPVETVSYLSPRGWRKYLYGSMFAENVVQAISRDFMAHALVGFEQESLNPFLHVHDEGACLREPTKLPLFMEIMSNPPKWGKGFPMLVEGYSGPIWSKVAKGYKEMHYLNGKCVWESKA